MHLHAELFLQENDAKLLHFNIRMVKFIINVVDSLLDDFICFISPEDVFDLNFQLNTLSLIHR